LPVFETVASVAAIVATFQGAAALYTTYKSRREAQQRGSGQDTAAVSPSAMDMSLALGSATVQTE